MLRIEASEAERVVAGCVLRDPVSIDDVRGRLGPDDFADYRCRLVYQAACDLRDAKRNVDAPAVLMLLTQRSQAEDLGTPPALFLSEVLDSAPTAANLEYAAGLVRDAAISRQSLAEVNEFVRDLRDPTGPPEEAIEGLLKRLAGVVDSRAATAGPVRFRDALRQTFDRIDQRNRGELPPAIPTGIDELDRMTGGGMHAEELSIVAARTSRGKSVMLAQMCQGAAENGYPVLYFSLEMGNGEIVERLVAANANVPLAKIRRGKGITPEELKRMIDLGEPNGLRDLPLFIEDRERMTVAQVAALARRFVRKERVRVVCVDYLQLLMPENRKAARFEQVSQISRDLKLLARELKVVVLTACQLNRDAAEEPPALHHLRESGSLEQDANNVFLLHQPEADDPNAESQAVSLTIAKQRNGPTGVVIDLAFAKPFTRFDPAGIPM